IKDNGSLARGRRSAAAALGNSRVPLHFAGRKRKSDLREGPRLRPPPAVRGLGGLGSVRRTDFAANTGSLCVCESLPRTILNLHGTNVVIHVAGSVYRSGNGLDGTRALTLLAGQASRVGTNMYECIGM